MKKLKPCPFCGSEWVQVRWIGFTNAQLSGYEIGYRGECTDCFAMTRAFPNSEDAKEAWNIRTDVIELTDTNVGKWIPIVEKLPQKCQYYLVTDFGVVEEAYYNSDGVWISRYDDKLKDVTHWMSLPKPPKDID